MAASQSFLQNPYYFMFASLAKPDEDVELHWLKVSPLQSTIWLTLLTDSHRSIRRSVGHSPPHLGMFTDTDFSPLYSHDSRRWTPGWQNAMHHWLGRILPIPPQGHRNRRS